LPLFEIDRQRAAAAVAAGIAAIGVAATITVPNEEIWHVIEYNVSASTDAGEAIATAPYFFSFLRLGGNFYEGTLGPVQSIGASSILLNSMQRDGGIWLGPGDRLGYLVASITGTVTLSTRALYVPYKR
ncbi:MAG TPA: hypothetical protein PKE65_10195, partial [Rhizobiaceae bacterium]|nr:hypothetical protein [Rhizobiaceae bacterium]